MRKSIIVFSTAALLFIVTGFTKSDVAQAKVEKTTVAIVTDSTETTEPENPNLTLYKKNVVASYYADRFNGRKTSSGEKFHNNKYTAAHLKLPFGTMIRVTNEKTGKFVDVKVNDRGPHSKRFEVDLTKKAYLEIAPNGGVFKCKIEIIK
jgi:rare lipoprotein A